MDIKGELKN